MTSTTMSKRQRRAQQLADLVAERKVFEDELAARKRAIEAEEKADEKAVDEALKHAGRARCAAVEELYALLDIEEDFTVSTLKDGTVRRTRRDRDETKRAARLVEAVVALVSSRDDAAEPVEAGIELPREAVVETVGEVTDATDPEDADGDSEDSEEEVEDPHERGYQPFGR